jgi:hypothetical protein
MADSRKEEEELGLEEQYKESKSCSGMVIIKEKVEIKVAVHRDDSIHRAQIGLDTDASEGK